LQRALPSFPLTMPRSAPRSRKTSFQFPTQASRERMASKLSLAEWPRNMRHTARPQSGHFAHIRSRPKSVQVIRVTMRPRFPGLTPLRRQPGLELSVAWSSRPSNRRSEAMPRGGRRSTSFRPGVSGNPGGRPKRAATVEARRIIWDVKAAARALTQDAIDTLVSIMKDVKAPAAARISAAQALLDRGHGKPAQVFEECDLTLLSIEDLQALERILRPRNLPPPALLTGHGG
jgi:hypothetical protein